MERDYGDEHPERMTDMERRRYMDREHPRGESCDCRRTDSPDSLCDFHRRMWEDDNETC
jgi:hypothetical protein